MNISIEEFEKSIVLNITKAYIDCLNSLNGDE